MRALPIMLLCGAAAAVRPGRPLEYAAGQFTCAAFHQNIRSDIRTESRGRTRIETAGRRALILLQAVERADGLAAEAWFDSLEVWRGTGRGADRPDTDGLLGGRCRGLLRPDGTWRAEDTPFIPDEVAELADLSNPVADLLPRLPPVRLLPGQRWSDSAGYDVRRLGDSTHSGVLLERYRVTRERRSSETRTMADSVPFEVSERERQHGTFVWHPLLGVLSYDRAITVETSIPSAGPIRDAIRSRLEQRVTLTRLPSDSATCR